MTSSNFSEIKRLKRLYVQLSKQHDLTPPPAINSLFRSLIELIVEAKQNLSLSEPEYEKLLQICAEGEYQLELFWNKKITTSQNPQMTLTKFPYYQNYIKLTMLEWSMVLRCTEHAKHSQVLFIGGGPLPLTAILLAKIYGVKSVVIEIDKQAVILAQKLIKAWDFDDAIKVVHSSVEEYRNFHEFAIIYLAALVGTSDHEKKEIISLIKKNISTKTHVVARSSYGNRKLLYRPIPESAIKDFKKVDIYHPSDDVINSVLILRKEIEDVQ